MFKKTCWTLLFICVSYFINAQNGSEPITVTDMMLIKTVGNVTLNKDGSKALFTVSEINPDKDKKWEYNNLTRIWITETGTGASPRALTADESASQPAWHPDGKQFAFVRTVEGKPQIFLLSLNGGEATQLTKFKYGATRPVWSPDGQSLLFSSSIRLEDLLKDSILNPKKQVPEWPDEKTGIKNNASLNASVAQPDPTGNLDQIRAYLRKNAEDNKATVINKLNFQNEMDVSSDLSFNQFFILKINNPDQPVLLTKIFYRFNQADFTPDGNQVVLTGNMDQSQHPDRSLESMIFMVNADGSNFRQLLGGRGESYSSPAVSPSGKWLAFQQGKTSFVSIPELAIMPINGTTKDIVTIPFDRNKRNFIWSPDEKYLFFLSQSNGGAPVYRVNIPTRKIEQLSDYNSGINDYDLAAGKLVFTKTEVINPSELYIADVNGKNARRISNFNTGWLADKKLSIPEKRTFTNSIGQTVEYWVMKPTHVEAGKKYPLLLEIHGGPSAMWGPGESSMWHEYQYFCSQGYGVVYSNPRGSGGYGEAFLRANMNDWGAGPASDVLTALDKTVAAEPWADTSRLLITGGSYAGYLVAWIISHDNRFKAACSQRGVYDLNTFFGEGNAWRLVPNYFGGYPWQPAVKAVLDRESPITYVQNITTPYIIFHGANDRRTGFVQAEMLYRSLKVLNRPVEFVRHPGATHEITRSGNNRQRIDQMLRTYEFFERWIGK